MQGRTQVGRTALSVAWCVMEPSGSSTVQGQTHVGHTVYSPTDVCDLAFVWRECAAHQDLVLLALLLNRRVLRPCGAGVLQDQEHVRPAGHLPAH